MYKNARCNVYEYINVSYNKYAKDYASKPRRFFKYD